MNDKVKVGVVGCGMISDTYFKASQRFRNIEVVACCAGHRENADAKAAEYNCKSMTYEELLASPEVEIVLNLTPPKMHTQVMIDSLNAGKHVYSEKPFGINFEEASQIMKLAQAKGLLVGCAPDTFLGSGLQGARKLIDDGYIGKVLSGTAIFQGRGPEKWAHAPAFYTAGGGAMLDMGPYYITALVHLLGPAKTVTAVTSRGTDFRTIGASVAPQYQDKYEPFGQYPVEIDTHQTGIITFANGAVITMIASFDVYKHGHNPIELYGTQGSMQVKDPNTFGCGNRVFRPEFGDWQDMPSPFGYAENSRSIGIADMAKALRSGRPFRANGELASHVLEIMLAFEKSAKQKSMVELETTCTQPAPLPLGLADGELD